MELTPIQTPLQEVAEDMGTIRSHVPALLKKRSWGAMELVRRGFGVDTAYRLAAGETDITLETVKRLCEIFELPIQKVVEFVKDE